MDGWIDRQTDRQTDIQIEIEEREPWNPLSRNPETENGACRL